MRALIIISLILLIGCNEKSKDKPDKKHKAKESVSILTNQFITEQDSLFIVHTMRCYLKEKNATWYNSRSDSSEFEVLQLLPKFCEYNFDKTKMLAISIIAYRSLQNCSFYKKDSVYHDIRAIVAHREDSCRIWSRYHPFEEIIINGFSNMDEALELATSFYYDEIKYKKIQHTIYDEKGNVDAKYHRIKYAVSDSLFWTKSPYWIKGLKLPSYYEFELYKNAGEVYPNKVKDYFECSYPDSLIDLFKCE